MVKSLLMVMLVMGCGAEPIEAESIQDLNTWCRDNLNQYVTCNPGGPGNLVCSAACGANSVCLSIDNQSHGRCNLPGSREP